MERWLSVTCGGILAIHGIRRGRGGLLQAISGAMMIRRGVTGKCEVYRALGLRTAPHDGALPYEQGIRARAAITIQRPRETVYQFWRQLENLPRFMQHLESVQPTEGNRSRWVAEGPAGRRYEWTAEIINEIPMELIAWKSLPGSDVDSAGSVHFKDAPGNRGTEIRVELQYNPPAGAIGALVARLFGREPEQEIRSDLRRLKQFLEAGEVATTEGQPKGQTTQGSNAVAQGLEEALA
jgi:uncharacterized membrane protein